MCTVDTPHSYNGQNLQICISIDEISSVDFTPKHYNGYCTHSNGTRRKGAASDNMTVASVWIYFSQEQLEGYLRLSDDAEAAARYGSLPHAPARHGLVRFLLPWFSPYVLSCLAGILSLNDYRFQARDAVKLDYASLILE